MNIYETPFSPAQAHMEEAMRVIINGSGTYFVMAGMRAGKTEALRKAIATAVPDHVVVVAPNERQARLNFGHVAPRTDFFGAYQLRDYSRASLEHLLAANPLWVFEDAAWQPFFEENLARVAQATKRIVALSSRNGPVGEYWTNRYATWDVNPLIPLDHYREQFRLSPLNSARDYGLEDTHNHAFGAELRRLMTNAE